MRATYSELWRATVLEIIFFFKSRIRRTFFKSLPARRDRSPVSLGGFYCSCTAFNLVQCQKIATLPGLASSRRATVQLIDCELRQTRTIAHFSVALNSSDHKWLQKFGEKFGEKERKRFHTLNFTFPYPNNLFDHFHPFPNQCKCKVIQIEESSKLALINLPW